MPAACGYGLLGISGHESIKEAKKKLLEFGQIGATVSFVEVVDGRCFQIDNHDGQASIKELTGALASEVLKAWGDGYCGDLDYDDWEALGQEEQIDIIVPDYRSRGNGSDYIQLTIDEDDPPEEKRLWGTQEAIERLDKIDMKSRKWLRKLLQTALNHRFLFTIAE